MRGGRRVSGDRGAAAARSRDDRAVRRAPPGRAGRPVRRGARRCARRPGWRRSGWSRSTAPRCRPTPAATRTSTTSSSRARSSRRRKAIDAAEDELYGEARGDELPPELATAQGRRGWLREAKRALDGEREQRGRGRSRAHGPSASRRPSAAWRRSCGPRCAPTRPMRPTGRAGVMQNGRRLGPNTPEALHAAGDPGGPDQRHRPRLAGRQGAARLHPGLQRPGRHQRAPDRHRRRGRWSPRRTSGTSNRCSTPPSANSHAAGVDRDARRWCSPTPATGTASRWNAIIDRGIPVLIPPDSSRRKGARPGWDGGLYDVHAPASWPPSTAASSTANASR